MATHEPPKTDDRREVDRAPLEHRVTVEVREHRFIGPGQNISEEGVFFEVEDSLPVRVQFGENDEWRDAEIIRVQSMGHGKLGIAVKFIED